MKHASVFMLCLFASATVLAEDSKLQLETTRIKANKELPQILYIVPWKDFEAPKTKEYKLKLHNFFGDLYDPLLATSSSEIKRESE